MTIVKKLIEEVRAAQAVIVERFDLPEGASAIRNGVFAKTSEVTIARVTDETITKFFEDYEEVEVDHYVNRNVSPPRRCWDDTSVRDRAPVTILIPKSTPEMLTVSRETLAVLAEHYEGTPTKDAAGNAALAEAKDVIA